MQSLVGNKYEKELTAGVLKTTTTDQLEQEQIVKCRLASDCIVLL